MTSPTDEELIAAARVWLSGDSSGPDNQYAIMRALADRLEALASRPDGWMVIESAPRDRPFWARKTSNEIALCWRHNPSSRTDEVVTWTGNQGFRAVEWRYPDPLPPAPQAEEA